MANEFVTILENIPFGKTLSNIVTLFRVSEWIDKIQMNIGAAFIILLYLFYTNSKINHNVFLMLVVFIIYQGFLACYGYAINAYADRKFDSMVGKYKGVSYFNKRDLSIILVFLSIGSLGIPLLLNDIRITILGIVAFILSSGYSLKPIRLKDRGLAGLICATLPQRPVMILIFGLMVDARPELVGILMGWALFIGLIMELGHQMLDYQNDITSGIHTWIVKADISKVKKYTFMSIFFYLLFIILPFYYFVPEIGLIISLIMMVFSGHSIFYFLDGWKAYKKDSQYNT